MTVRPKLTPARRRGLQVLAHSGNARISNATSHQTVYWQTARWLLHEGLAVERYGPGTEWLVITGRGACKLVAHHLQAAAQ